MLRYVSVNFTMSVGVMLSGACITRRSLADAFGCLHHAGVRGGVMYAKNELVDCAPEKTNNNTTLYYYCSRGRLVRWWRPAKVATITTSTIYYLLY